MSVEFDTPANRIIAQFQPKNQFGINPSLPDVAFYRQLAIQGRLRYFQGNLLTDEATTIGFTPANGETFFFINAVMLNNNTTTSRVFTVINDNTTRQTALMAPLTNSGSLQETSFPLDSLVGDGIKRYKITSNVDNEIACNMFGWVENTSRIRDPAP